MEDLTLDFQEITDICKSKMEECRVQYQKAYDKGNLEGALQWLTAEHEIQVTLNTLLRRIRDRQAMKILEELKEIYGESA